MNHKKILFITPRAYVKTNERASGITRVLTKRYDIHVILVNYEGKSPIQNLIKLLLSIPKIYFFGIKYNADIILCELIELGFIGTILSILKGRPCIWDVQRNTLNLCKELNKPKVLEIIYIGIERILWRFVKKVLVSADAEKQAYAVQGLDSRKIEVIPISADFGLTKEIDTDKTNLRNKLGINLNKKILLFFGGLDYQPNKIAAQWINNNLAPAIHDRFGENIDILIVGNGEICNERHHPIVNFLGFKSNIFEYIYASDIVIVPVWKGEGQQTKLIDSMMCAKLTIVNKISSVGIPQLIDGYNTIIAQNKDEFIMKTLIALKNIDNLGEIEINAKRMIETHYNWDRWKQNLYEIIEK